MKTSLIALVVMLILGSAAWALQAKSGEINHAACLSQADITWYQNRSKSGIARSCNESVLQHNLEREAKQ